MRDPVFHRRLDYDRGLIPNAYLRELDAAVSSIEEARERTGASIGYPGWTIIYSLLLATLPPSRPGVIVETGTNFGASTIILAQALNDTAGGAVHSFEIEAELHHKAGRLIDEAGLSDLAQLHLGDSRRLLPALLSKNDMVVDAAFLDGAHDAATLLEEFAAVRPHLRKGAPVFMDNTYPIAEPEKGEAPRVNQALSTILDRFGGQLLNLPFVSWYTPGLAIWQGETPLNVADWDADPAP